MGATTLSIETRTVFRYWNHKKETMTHRVFSDKRKRKINTVLKDYDVYEVLKAIFNYATILGSPNHFWTYSWTIEDFLQRGLEKFLDEANPYENFQSSRGQFATETKPQVKSSAYKDRFERYRKASPEERKKLEQEWRDGI